MVTSHKTMPHTSQLLPGRSGSADGNFRKNLSGVRIDDGNMKKVGNTQAKLRLSDSCRANITINVFKGLVPSKLFDNTALGSFNKVHDILDFRGQRKFFPDLLDGLRPGVLALIDDAVCLMHLFNSFIGESATAQPDQVDSGIANGLFSCNNERRDIHRKAGAALNHDIAADAAELVHQDGGTDDGKVVDGDLAGELCRIADDTAASDDAVMGDMHVFHQQVVVAHNCCAFGSRSTGDGDVFSDRIVVTDFTNRVLASEFQVLRLGGDACARQNLIPVANARTIIDGNTVLEMIVVANNRVSVDETERANHIIFSKFRFRVHERQRTDLIHKYK